VIGAFIYTYLEYVVGGVGAVGFIGYMLTRKTHDHSNDLTPYVVKLGRQKDAITKQTK
jgi:hypothetical protein